MATYDISTDEGKVRLLISDIGGQGGSDFIFEDNEIEAFLAMESDSIYRAAGMACRTMAGNEAMVSKRITFLELQTDGPGVAVALLDLAKALDKKADDVDDDDGAGFEIAEINTEMYPHWKRYL